MYITRKGEIIQVDDADWAKSAYAAKGWVPCDPPVAKPLPEPTYEDQRQQAYQEQGLTTDALLAALWEAQMEPSAESSQTLADLQAKRAAIKKQFPKG